MVVDLSEEKITDSPEKSRITKPVVHIKKRIQRFNMTTLEEYVDATGNPAQNGQKTRRTGPFVYNYSWGWPGLTDPLAAVGYHVIDYPKTVDQLRAMALKQFHDQNQVDNLLNAVELGQLKSGSMGVFNFLKSCYVDSKEIGQDLIHGLGGNDAASVRAYLRGKRRLLKTLPFLRDGYLFYSFGIAPLLGDIQKVNRGLKTLERDLQNAVKQNGKQFTAVARCDGSFVKNPAFAESGYSANGTTGFWTTDLLGRAQRRVGVKGRNTVVYNSDTLKKLHYMVSRYVATGPASFVWERIPFSFVVDWFVDLSALIHTADNVLTGSFKSVDDMWFTEDFNLAVRIRHKSARPGYWVSTAEGHTTAQWDVKYYSRSHLGHSLVPVPSGRFGKKQLTQLSALLYQQVAKLR